MMSRLIATAYARVDFKVLIADMDTSQSTSKAWNLKRQSSEVDCFSDIDEVLVEKEMYDLIVFDGAPHANRLTAQIASVCQLILLLTDSSIDDLNPQIRLAHEIINYDVKKKNWRLFSLDLEVAKQNWKKSKTMFPKQVIFYFQPMFQRRLLLDMQ